MTPKARRELDALVAEKVFGHTTRVVEYLQSYSWKDADRREYAKDDPDRVNLGMALVEVMEREQIMYEHYDERGFHVRLNCVPHYSTEIAAAWEVVEKDDGWGYDWKVKRWVASSKPWSCTAERTADGQTFYAEAMTAPLAICLAALKAVE